MNSRPDKFIPALYGGIVMALLTSVPFLNFINCLCCAGVLLGGFLAVFFYSKNFTPDTPPFTVGECMAVGAMAGVVGAVLGTLLSLLFISMFGNVLLEFLQRMVVNLDLPQEALDALEKAIEERGSAFSIISDVLLNIVIDTIFGMLGGLIGYSVFKRKEAELPPAAPAL
jgi:hypothetical protein